MMIAVHARVCETERQIISSPSMHKITVTIELRDVCVCVFIKQPYGVTRVCVCVTVD